jgi:mono/diheme cytochrome c family protein
MLSTISLVVAGLSSGHKIGLAVVGGAFITFALGSSFVMTRRDPNFPGKRMPVYIAVCVLFFIAMLSAVVIFGRESKEATAAAAPAGTAPATTTTPATTTPATTTPATTTPATTAPVTTAPATTAPAATTPATTSTGTGAGDPVAGKAVFASAGCTGCHTLKAANATGTVGPNLDQLKPALAKIIHQVNVGGGPMPAFKGSLSVKQIADVAAFVYTSTHS